MNTLTIETTKILVKGIKNFLGSKLFISIQNMRLLNRFHACLNHYETSVSETRTIESTSACVRLVQQ